MTLMDRLRRWSTVQTYDFWLDYESVPGRRRRAERRELARSIDEVAADRGMSRALAQVGSVRELARAVGEGYADRARWAVGAYAALPVFALLAYGYLFSAMAFLEGVDASGVTGRRVSSTQVLPWLGTTFFATVQPDHGGLSVGGGFPWATVILPLIVFLVVSRCWRVITRRFGNRRTATT